MRGRVARPRHGPARPSSVRADALPGSARLTGRRLTESGSVTEPSGPGGSLDRAVGARTGGRATAVRARVAADVRDRSGELPPDAMVWSAIGGAWQARLEGGHDTDAWTAAARAADTAGYVLEGARARCRAAQGHLAAGDRAAAAAALAAVVDTARQTGARALLDAAEDPRSRARLDRADARTPGGPGTDHRLGLTERELQVLRLLADGRTNREVGEALFMSPKTAQRPRHQPAPQAGRPRPSSSGPNGRRLGLV